MATFPYTSSSVRASWSELADHEEIVIELGPTSSPAVTLTIAGASVVIEPTGPWTNCAKTFTSASGLEDALTIKASDSEGRTKELYIKPKPGGGLPGDSPV